MLQNYQISISVHTYRSEICHHALFSYAWILTSGPTSSTFIRRQCFFTYMKLKLRFIERTHLPLNMCIALQPKFICTHYKPGIHHIQSVVEKEVFSMLAYHSLVLANHYNKSKRVLSSRGHEKPKLTLLRFCCSTNEIVDSEKTNVISAVVCFGSTTCLESFAFATDMCPVLNHNTKVCLFNAFQVRLDSCILLQSLQEINFRARFKTIHLVT